MKKLMMSRCCRPTYQLGAIVVGLALFFGVVSAQYARALGVARATGAYGVAIPQKISQNQPPVKWTKGDGINSFQSAPFTVSVLCPQELSFLIRVIARGIHLSGMTAGMCRFLSGAAGLRVSPRNSLLSILLGATVFGAASVAPDILRAIASFSLGYLPF